MVDRQALIDLMKRLGGHPLSLYLVLPHLREHSPAELSERFEELLPGFVTGADEERNESLMVSPDFSLRRLGEATRAALPDLAVFQGGAFEDDLLAITEMDEDLWQAARSELEQAALVTVEQVPGVTPPFLSFHPTRLPYLADRLPDDRRVELEERYWQRSYAVANYLYQSDTQHPHQARAIAMRELPNLRRALDLAIEAGAAEEAVDFAGSIAKFLNNFGRWRERDALLEKVGGLSVAGEGLTKAEFLLLSQQGETLLQAGRAAEAEQVFRKLLERLEAGAEYDAAYVHALTQLRLGIALDGQGQHRASIQFKKRALDEFKTQSSSDSARRMLGNCHHRIANSQLALGDFDKAKTNYGKALAMFQQENAERSAATSLAQLGTLALMRGDLDEAHQRYSEALDTFRTLGEPGVEAVSWHQLGIVAQKAEDWDEAERCCKEAVRIFEQLGDSPTLAKVCNNLAVVARLAGRPGDAEGWYLRAIEIHEQVGNPRNLAVTYSNLAGLYLSQDHLDEAERHARRAVEIVERYQIQTEVWKMYSILADIAEARGDADEAARWRRKEQESYAAFAGAAHEIQQYQPLIAAVVEATQGDPEAQAFVDEEYQKMRASGGRWQRAADAIERVIAGERDVGTLTHGLDRETGYIIRRILAQLAGDQAFEGSHTSQDVGPTAQTSEVSETSEVSQAVALLRQQWAPVVEAVVGACQRDAEPEQMEPFLEELSQQEVWRELAAVLRRIVAGERDAHVLLAGLDATDTVIASDVLRALGVELPEERGLSLDDLLDLVFQACQPTAPAGLGEQLFTATHRMSIDSALPPELRAYGRVLNHVLAGERDPDLSALPQELAERVQAMLTALRAVEKQDHG